MSILWRKFVCSVLSFKSLHSGHVRTCFGSPPRGTRRELHDPRRTIHAAAGARLAALLAVAGQPEVVAAGGQVCTVAQLMTSDNLRKLMAMQQVPRRPRRPRRASCPRRPRRPRRTAAPAASAAH